MSRADLGETCSTAPATAGHPISDRGVPLVDPRVGERQLQGCHALCISDEASRAGLRYLPAFSFNALRAARQAKTAPGNLAVSLLADSNFAFWTRTLWNDQDAMRVFMLSGRAAG
jgi:hypothetical protein